MWHRVLAKGSHGNTKNVCHTRWCRQMSRFMRLLCGTFALAKASGIRHQAWGVGCRACGMGIRQMGPNFYGAPPTHASHRATPHQRTILAACSSGSFSHTCDNCSRSSRSDTKTVAMQLGSGVEFIFFFWVVGLIQCHPVFVSADAGFENVFLRKDPRIILISFVLHCANFSGIIDTVFLAAAIMLMIIMAEPLAPSVPGGQTNICWPLWAESHFEFYLIINTAIKSTRLHATHPHPHPQPLPLHSLCKLSRWHLNFTQKPVRTAATTASCFYFYFQANNSNNKKKEDLSPSWETHLSQTNICSLNFRGSS